MAPPSGTPPETPAETDPRSGPISRAERITSLDLIRGFAILGILPMNALYFGLEPAGYFNVSADGVAQPLDWVLGVLTMIFVDQKMMALFSLLFGVGVVVFADRAEAKGRRVIGLSLWRFALLFLIGLAHTAVWDGDVLLLYAVCAPMVLALRRLPARVLGGIGVVLALLGTVLAPWFQTMVGADGAELGEYWLVGRGDLSVEVETWFVINGVGRALGLMLIGVALFRLDIVQGQRSADFYRRLAVWGVGLGTAVTAAGLAFRVVTDWSADHALTGSIPTGLGTIPMALGYMALAILWNRGSSPHLERFRNAGRMALTNYLTQTAFGLVVLGWLLADVDVTRTMIAVWILGVWALQLWWSTVWLDRFRYGPVEWAWRCATYRTWQPIRRPVATAG